MIVSNVGIEVRALEIAIPTPGLLVPSVTQINPDTQENPRKQAKEPNSKYRCRNHISITFGVPGKSLSLSDRLG